MKFNVLALIKSKIFWANVVGAVVALGAVFGVTPEMSGQTAEYATALLAILNIVFRVFSNNPVVTRKSE